MTAIRIKQIATALVLAGIANVVFAQYVWIDEKGVRQYSDRAPPASIPRNHILKEPRSASSNAAKAASESVEATDDAASQASTKASAPLTTAEKNADYQKRKIEQAEKDKKAADEAKLKADKAKNCERAQEYARALQDGNRIAHTDKNGERSYLSDDQREQELREAKQRISSDCK